MSDDLAAPDAPGVKDCCKTPGSLYLADEQPGAARLYRCSACGCRHFTVRAEPGHFGVFGRPVGEKTPPAEPPDGYGSVIDA
jgi:hypothetical protein